MPRAETNSAAQAARTTRQYDKENTDMIKLSPVLGTLVSATLAVGSTGVALADSAGHRQGADEGRAGLGPQGAALVLAWNRELLQIVQVPGAQPSTTAPTRR